MPQPLEVPYSCRYEGRWYREGEEFRMGLNGCSVCICVAALFAENPVMVCASVFVRKKINASDKKDFIALFLSGMKL